MKIENVRKASELASKYEYLREMLKSMKKIRNKSYLFHFDGGFIGLNVNSYDFYLDSDEAEIIIRREAKLVKEKLKLLGVK
jgi:hypothetical protein